MPLIKVAIGQPGAGPERRRRHGPGQEAGPAPRAGSSCCTATGRRPRAASGRPPTAPPGTGWTTWSPSSTPTAWGSRARRATATTWPPTSANSRPSAGQRRSSTATMSRNCRKPWPVRVRRQAAGRHRQDVQGQGGFVPGRQGGLARQDPERKGAAGRPGGDRPGRYHAAVRILPFPGVVRLHGLSARRICPGRYGLHPRRLRQGAARPGRGERAGRGHRRRRQELDHGRGFFQGLPRALVRSLHRRAEHGGHGHGLFGHGLRPLRGHLRRLSHPRPRFHPHGAVFGLEHQVRRLARRRQHRRRRPLADGPRGPLPVPVHARSHGPLSQRRRFLRQAGAGDRPAAAASPTCAPPATRPRCSTATTRSSRRAA